MGALEPLRAAGQLPSKGCCSNRRVHRRGRSTSGPARHGTRAPCSMSRVPRGSTGDCSALVSRQTDALWPGYDTRAQRIVKDNATQLGFEFHEFEH